MGLFFPLFFRKHPVHSERIRDMIAFSFVPGKRAESFTGRDTSLKAAWLIRHESRHNNDTKERRTMIQYLIVCPLVFLAGFVDAIAGGGGLFPPAYIIAGVPAHFAIGTNKLASAMGTTISTGRYLKNGYLKGKQMLQIAVAACIASSLVPPSAPAFLCWSVNRC